MVQTEALEMPCKVVSIGPSWNQAMLLLISKGALTDLEDHIHQRQKTKTNKQKSTLMRPSCCQRQLAEDETRSRQSRTLEDATPSIDGQSYNTPLPSHPLFVLPPIPTPHITTRKEKPGRKDPATKPLSPLQCTNVGEEITSQTMPIIMSVP